jgi:hypothetical protein
MDTTKRPLYMAVSTVFWGVFSAFNGDGHGMFTTKVTKIAKNGGR